MKRQDDAYRGGLLQVGLRRGKREGADGTEGWGAVGTRDVFWIWNIQHLRHKMYILDIHTADRPSQLLKDQFIQN